MPDVTRFRAKLAAIIPSTNAVVEHDLNATRPPGVTVHAGRMYIRRPELGSDEQFEELLGQIRQSIAMAIRDVVTCAPDYVVMGMSAETFWNGTAGNAGFERRVGEMSGGLGVSTGAGSCRDGLNRIGVRPWFFQFAAHAPEVAELYRGQFDRDLFFQGRLPVRLKELVPLRLAALNGRSFCQVGDAASAMEHGVSEDEIAAVFAERDDGFRPAERAALAAARSMSNVDPYEVVELAVRDELATHFSQAELVELFVLIGVLTGMARMLAAVGFVQRARPVPQVCG